MKRHVVFFALLSFVSLPVYSQQPTRISDSLDVTLVEVPVTVIDRAGNPIRGLTAANFEILDEGKSRAVSHFEELDLAAIETARPNAPMPMNPAARRNFMLLFDLSNSLPGNVLRARDAAKDFVAGQVGKNDLVAIATFSIEHGFRLLTTFTTDRNLVRIAIDTLGNPKFFRSFDPLHLSALVTDTVDAFGESGPGTSRAAMDREIATVVEDYNRMSNRSNEEFRRGRVRRQLRNFGAIARALDNVNGRKQVILLSEGFDARLIQGRPTEASAESQADGQAVLFGESWKIDSDARFGNTAAISEVDEMANLFKRSDVVLHAIDVRGLRGNVDARDGLRLASNESLFLLANPTGGHVFKDANDLTTNFKKLLKQQEVVYILGFHAPSSGTPGRFHTLKVKLIDVAGGARASHRAGYYEPALKTTPIEETLSASAILMNDIPQTDLSLETMVVPFPSRGLNARVPVIIEVDGKKLMTGVNGNELRGEIFVYAFDREGIVRDFLHQRFALDLKDARAMLEQGGVKYYGTLSLGAGDYVIKSLVRVPETDRAGYQRTELNVPQFAQGAVLPPFVYEDEGKWIMLKGKPRSVDDVAYPFEVARESFVPTAQPRMKSGSTYKLALFTYNLGDGALQLEANVRAAGGQSQKAEVSVVGRTARDEQGATKLVLNFTPADLTPGTYSLELAVRDAAGGAAQVANTGFVVE